MTMIKVRVKAKTKTEARAKTKAKAKTECENSVYRNENKGWRSSLFMIRKLPRFFVLAGIHSSRLGMMGTSEKEGGFPPSWTVFRPPNTATARSWYFPSRSAASSVEPGSNPSNLISFHPSSRSGPHLSLTAFTAFP
jgi:hypothetical protein